MPQTVWYLGFLHLHDVGLTVGNAVVNVVNVGRQCIHFLTEGKRCLLWLRPLSQKTVSLPDHLLLALCQLLSLLCVKKTNYVYQFSLNYLEWIRTYGRDKRKLIDVQTNTLTGIFSILLTKVYKLTSIVHIIRYKHLNNFSTYLQLWYFPLPNFVFTQFV